MLKHAFPLLAEDRPVSIFRLAEAAGTTADLARRAVGSARVTLDGNGDVVELFGVALSRALHRIRFETGTHPSISAVTFGILWPSRGP